MPKRFSVLNNFNSFWKSLIFFPSRKYKITLLLFANQLIQKGKFWKDLKKNLYRIDFLSQVISNYFRNF